VRQVAVELAVIGLGHQQLDVLPDGLGGGVAKQALGGRVEVWMVPRASMVMMPSTTVARIAAIRSLTSLNAAVRSVTRCSSSSFAAALFQHAVVG
jgi:hypothetical protein